MKIEKQPAGERPFRYDTPFWSHFGYGTGWAYARCNRCLAHVTTTHTPNADTVNCWKILIFGEAVTDFPAVTRYLVERAEQDRRFLGKWRRGETSLAVVYATSELQRDRLKVSIFKDLKARGLLRSSYLPYRRGCKAFEKVLGPWREWELPAQPVPPRDSAAEPAEAAED